MGKQQKQPFVIITLVNVITVIVKINFTCEMISSIVHACFFWDYSHFNIIFTLSLILKTCGLNFELVYPNPLVRISIKRQTKEQFKCGYVFFLFLSFIFLVCFQLRD